MRKRALALAFTAATLVATFGQGTAAAAGTEACTTWQYFVTDTAYIRDAPGGNVKHTAVRFDLANITQRPDAWYYGNFYFGSNGNWYASGWILASKLQYNDRCW